MAVNDRALFRSVVEEDDVYGESRAWKDTPRREGMIASSRETFPSSTAGSLARRRRTMIELAGTMKALDAGLNDE